jgi:ATP-dependent Lhr-like helicase
MQFLFHWHGMGEERPQGDEALLSALDKLEGCCIAAAAWERDVLPVRLQGYQSIMLDRLCGSGRILWTRLMTDKTVSKSDQPIKNKATLLRNSPISLLLRENAELWQSLRATDNNQRALSSSAQAILDTLEQHGASFFFDIVKHSGQLRTQVEESLAELAALGLVTSDSFAGLRALITPGTQRPGFGRHHRRRRAVALGNSIDDAGRWSLINTKTTETTPSGYGWIKTGPDVLEHIAYTLLKRYGVVFRKVLEREPLLPPWRELLYQYRRMEARGEIRGGRFVEGFSGEQFTLPEAVGLLRKQRHALAPDQDFVISATDPLNLIGIILPGERIPALYTNRILFRNGQPIAKQLNDDIQYLQPLNAASQWQVKNLFTLKYNPAGYITTPVNPYQN